MAIKLSPPILKDYTLEKSDKKFGNNGSPTIITVRQASQGDYETRARLYSQFVREFDVDGKMRIAQETSFDDLAREEVFLTLSACNILNESGAPLFEFENGRLKKKEQFESAWAALDPFIAGEIHDCVIDLNVMWGFPTIPPKAGKTQ